MVDLTPTARGYLQKMLLISSYYIAGKSVNCMTIGGIFAAGGDSKFGYVSPYKHVRQYENHQKYDDKHLEKGFYRVSFFIFHFVFTFFVRLTITAFIVFAKLQVIISSLAG